LGELEKAFNLFNRLSGQLQGAYEQLEHRVAALTTELEEARRARQAAADEAKSTAERLRSLLATLPAGVIVVDAVGTIQDCNRAAEEILGPNLIGEPWQGVARA